MDIHARIKQRRMELGLSHEALAKRISEIEGLSKHLSWQTIQQWENRTTAPKRSRLPNVALALEIPLETLLGLPSAQPLGAVDLPVQHELQHPRLSGLSMRLAALTGDRKLRVLALVEQLVRNAEIEEANSADPSLRPVQATQKNNG